MSSRSDLSAELKEFDFLFCEVCFWVFEDPRLLPCGHTFCKDCLLSWQWISKKEWVICPKCKIYSAKTIQNATQDVRIKEITQMISLEKKRANSKTSQTYEVHDYKLSCWLVEKRIPQNIARALVDKGFEFLDIVLDMTYKDVQNMGLKSEDMRILWMAINEGCLGKGKETRAEHSSSSIGSTEHSPPHLHPASDINGKSTPSTKTEEDVDDYLQDWATVSYVVDDSFLASGTHDAEFIERWRKLKDNKDDSFYLQTILSRGKALRESKNVPDVVKARCLYQLAVILCDGSFYDEAVKFSTDSLKLARQFPCVFWDSTVLLAYVAYNKTRLSHFCIETAKLSIQSCDDAIYNQSDLVPAKLVKVYILKAATLAHMVENEKYHYGSHKTLDKIRDYLGLATDLCMIHKLSGLCAEVLWLDAWFLRKTSKCKKQGFEKLLEAREICIRTYGEFNLLSARIYQSLGITYDDAFQAKKAYDCFRRSWAIRRQIQGRNHPETQAIRDILIHGYMNERRAPEIEKPDPEKRDQSLDENEESMKNVKFLDKVVFPRSILANYFQSLGL